VNLYFMGVVEGAESLHSKKLMIISFESISVFLTTFYRVPLIDC